MQAFSPGITRSKAWLSPDSASASARTEVNQIFGLVGTWPMITARDSQRACANGLPGNYANGDFFHDLAP
jgi:hypothetical protein